MGGDLMQGGTTFYGGGPPHQRLGGWVEEWGAGRGGGSFKEGFGKCVFEVHDTFPQGRFCGVKIAFLKAKWHFSRRGVFVKPTRVFEVNMALPQGLFCGVKNAFWKS